jgi:hypothetical protein
MESLLQSFGRRPARQAGFVRKSQPPLSSSAPCAVLSQALQATTPRLLNALICAGLVLRGGMPLALEMMHGSQDEMLSSPEGVR